MKGMREVLLYGRQHKPGWRERWKGRGGKGEEVEWEGKAMGEHKESNQQTGSKNERRKVWKREILRGEISMASLENR